MKNTEKCMEFSIQIGPYRDLLINSHCIDGPNRPLLSVNRKKIIWNKNKKATAKHKSNFIFNYGWYESHVLLFLFVCFS